MRPQQPDYLRGGRPARSCLAGLFLAATVLCGCDGDAPREGAVVYRHALDGKVTSTDPARSASVHANHLVLSLYDTL